MYKIFEKEMGKQLVKIDWGRYIDLIHQLETALRKKKFDLIIGISRGGLLPGIILSHKWNTPLGVVATFSYKNRIRGKLTVSDLALPIYKKYKKVLIVDDLTDSGATMIRVKSLIKQRFPESYIYTATIHADPELYEPDFYLVVKEREEWIVYPYESTCDKT